MQQLCGVSFGVGKCFAAVVVAVVLATVEMVQWSDQGCTAEYRWASEFEHANKTPAKRNSIGRYQFCNRCWDFLNIDVITWRNFWWFRGVRFFV